MAKAGEKRPGRNLKRRESATGSGGVRHGGAREAAGKHAKEGRYRAKARRAVSGKAETVSLDALPLRRRLGRQRAASGKAETVPLDLHFAVKNFGPIAHGSINIRPLTILIGPNNSGKSYVAMLLRSILAAQSRVSRRRFTGDATTACHNILQRKYELDKHKMAITRPESKKILGVLLDEELGPELKKQIARDFGSNMRDLVLAGKSSASVKVSEHDPDSGETRSLSIRLGDDLSVRAAARPVGYLVDAVPGRRYYRISVDERQDRRGGADRGAEDARHAFLDGPYMHGATVGMDPYMLCSLSADTITENISSRLQFRTVPHGTYYFPAARSGILQGHKALSASIVAHAPYGGIEQIEIPPVTGVIADFISQIILLRRTRGPFATVAGDMENELFGGSIVLDAATRNEYPEITYRFGKSVLPLHRSSSTISEIAPLSLYLKHIVGESSFLIIEEPEAHLHPANQLVLAKYLVRMIRGGISILMTTHSVFLLEKLAKYMMAGRLAPGQRSADLGYGQDDFLTQDEVSAYLFERRPDGSHQIKPVERDEEYGISQEEFVRVSEELHRETVIINSKMRASGNA